MNGSLEGERMWHPTGAVDPCRLVNARLQLHWAAQAAAGVGRSLLPKQSDFSQESFQWSDELGVLLQGCTAGPRPFRSGIRFRDLTLLLLGDDDAVLDSLPLHGRTLADAFSFYQTRCSELLGSAVTIAPPPEGLPEHAVAHGEAFETAVAELEELERYYAGASSVLRPVSATQPGAGPLRCWPHHFDLATLIALSGSGENAHTIGVGMSPGDGSYEQPYYYVTPWPYPEAASLPPLTSGHWHTAEWTAAVLPASELSTQLPARQRSAIEAFLAEAIGNCRAIS